ncbi:dehydrogenase [Subtercola boreus]|uniref:Dehydrogenase n=1 Tax=Subtercola boreus TaxID=120213 RepID=A0A3E0WF41_9MICO|nr:Gfo/Idh/MocA family oxidoreductase [Subtercola boreus]RFA28094.1 dehydrogenase [Subtercola boreus]
MLTIGILGAAGIAPAAIIRPARRRTDVAVLAVAARSAASGARYAAEHGIARSYEGYAALLDDPEIDLVYNALPPSEHAEWSIRALEAGKHVLCEKPFAMNAAEAQRMVDAADASGFRLIEAFHDRYHPLSAELDAVRASGMLGEILSVSADFSSTNVFDPASLRHDPLLGGGSLMDLGCYPLHWVRAFLGEEPEVVEASATLNPLGADLSVDALLRFPSGVEARVTSAMVEHPHLNASFDAVGTLGTLHVENLVFPSRGHSLTSRIDGVERNWTVRGEETYDHQLDALSSGVPLLTEGADSVANMVLIDAIYAAAGVLRP